MSLFLAAMFLLCAAGYTLAVWQLGHIAGWRAHRKLMEGIKEAGK